MPKKLEPIDNEGSEEELEEVPVPRPTSKKEALWEVAQVPTEYGIAIVNKKTNEAFDINSAIAKIMNDLEELKKLL
jgi:hypothetical protein